MQTLLLGGGCFWCTQAVFDTLKGVQTVIAGYAGGDSSTANYQTVCTGNTGHIEVVQVVFDETLIDPTVILDVFFAIHDPTTLNRQGDDIGTQYASVIFYHTDEQKHLSQNKIQALKDEGVAVVTQLLPAPTFYPAEEYHQNFFAKNPTQGYCNFAIPPKLAKLRQYFLAHTKSDNP